MQFKTWFASQCSAFGGFILEPLDQVCSFYYFIDFLLFHFYFYFYFFHSLKCFGSILSSNTFSILLWRKVIVLILIDKLFMNSISSLKVGSCSLFACWKRNQSLLSLLWLVRTIRNCYRMSGASTYTGTCKGAFLIIAISIRTRITFCYMYSCLQ